MSKIITKELVWMLMLTMCLCSCSSGEKEQEISDALIDGNSTTNTVEVENSLSQSKIQHITRDLADNLKVDADVICPQRDSYSSYLLKQLQISTEVATNVFFDNDTNSVTIINEDEFGKYDEGCFVLKAENGNKFSSFPPAVSYCTQEEQKYLEIQELLHEYAIAHPQDVGKSIGFMRAEDALNLGMELLEKLGISFTTENVTCLGLEHDQIIAWQHELLNDATSGYNDFGKAMIFSELAETDDAYYLQIPFFHDGIEIYGSDSAPVALADDCFPPSRLYAEIVITPNGIQLFSTRGAYSVAEEKFSGKIISVEEAIEKLREKNDLLIGASDMTVSSIHLEYIPIEIGDTVVLTPYWCFEETYEYVGGNGNTYVSEGEIAERFNAFTGKDLAYGG